MPIGDPANYEAIRYEIEDSVLTITLNRPEKLNAFNLNMDLSSGGSTFNRDVNADGAIVNEVHRDGGGLVSLRIFECLKPVIAAINGAAVGVGVTSTLPMDIRLASEDARFGFVFSRRGIVPEACSSWFLPRVVGISRATEWCYSGRIFDAAEALEGGLVRSVVPADELLPLAREIALDIAQNSSAISVTLTRHMMWRMLGADHPMEAHKIDSRGVQATGASADAREGVESFLEKRPANYTLKPSADMPDFFPWWEDPEFS